MVNRLPKTGTVISNSDPMCMPSQTQPKQNNGFSRLQAAPGSAVALRFQENGHVTIKNSPLGKPGNSGNVYVYGTTQPKSDEKILDVFKQWTADGKGGDGRGRLLSVQYHPLMMDNVIRRVAKPASVQRQAEFSKSFDTLMGSDLWCQQDFKIPTDADTGKATDSVLGLGLGNCRWCGPRLANRQERDLHYMYGC